MHLRLTSDITPRHIIYLQILNNINKLFINYCATIINYSKEIPTIVIEIIIVALVQSIKVRSKLTGMQAANQRILYYNNKYHHLESIFYFLYDVT